MILRRLADAIKGQNWFTVVLEILIVVVGIFMGLQVNDWNQARQDRTVEMRYLERLHTDLLTDWSRLDRSEVLTTIRMRQVELLLGGIADTEVAASQPNQFIEAVEKVSWGSYRPITPKAYAELVGTGKTALIRSESLRDSLAEYYALIDYWDEVLDQSSFAREYSIATAGVLDIDHLAIIQTSGSATGDADLGADSGDAISIAEQLKSRAQGTRLLPMIHESHFLVTIVIAEHRQRNEALRIAIEEQLNGERNDP